MCKKLFAVRGATSTKNSERAITKNVVTLYNTLLETNKIYETDIVSIHFTLTDDLTTLNPATALRKNNLANDIPLFCSAEPKLANSLPHTIRVIIHFYGIKKPTPIYLEKAQQLRPDITSKKNIQSLWLVTREYAGIAEAGGIKNVVKDLAENCTNLNIDTTVFLPVYGCSFFAGNELCKSNISVYNHQHAITFYKWEKAKINFIFIKTDIFINKKNIYTYTNSDIKTYSINNNNIQKGDSYNDTDEMNTIFQMAVLEYAKINRIAPSALHCHDAHTASLPAFINNNSCTKELFKNTIQIVTIHNAGDSYRQRLFGLEYTKAITNLPDQILSNSMINDAIEPFIIASKYAKLTTVSEWYATELITPELSPFSRDFAYTLKENGIKITGITNGINYKHYSPQKTENSLLPFSFNPLEDDFTGKYQNRDFLLSEIENTHLNQFKDIQTFGNFNNTENKKYIYFAYHGRLVHQKGIEVLLKVIPSTLAKNHNIRFIIMGHGSKNYENNFIEYTNNFDGNIIFISGYNKSLSRLVICSADFILLPSLFEPCGLEDFIAQIFATIPIAHACGGLQKIDDNKTGFLFHSSTFDNNEQEMTEKLTQIILEKTYDFINSRYQHILDNQNYKNIIKLANKKIKNKYVWKNIIKNKYFPLYGF